MAGDDAALQAEHARTLDDLRHVMAAGVEMFVEMEVQVPAGVLGGAEEEIEEGRRVVG